MKSQIVISSLDALNSIMIIAGLSIYSSFYSWGFTAIEADGMQLFLVVFLVSPVLLLSSCVGFIVLRQQSSIRHVYIPAVTGLLFGTLVADQHITLVRANIALALGGVLLMSLIVLIFLEARSLKPHNKSFKRDRPNRAAP